MNENPRKLLSKRKVYISIIGVILTCFPIFLYELSINTLLNHYNIIDIGFNDAVISTFRVLFFAIFGALYAMWRQWERLSEYLALGTAAFLPIMIIVLSFPMEHNYPIESFESLSSSYAYIIILKHAPAIYVTTIGYWFIVFKSPLNKWAEGRPLPSNSNDGHSQNIPTVHRNRNIHQFEIDRFLRLQFLERSFLSIVISINVTVLTVLVLIIAEISLQDSFIFCLITTLSGFVCLLIRHYIIKLGNFGFVAEFGIISMNIIMAGSWGSLSFFIFDKENLNLIQLLLSLLACGGFAMVTLSGQRLSAVIAAALALFIPFVYLLIHNMPEDWGVYAAASCFCILVILGFGYTVFRQNEEQARLHLSLLAANEEINTKSKRLEQALIEADKANKRIQQEYGYRERVLRAVGHDLRQPINALDLFLYQLSKAGIDKTAFEIVNMCRDCTRSASKIIESLSQMAWLSGKIIPDIDQPLVLTPLFRRLCTEFQTEAAVKGIRIRSVPCSLLAIADDRLVERILRNYLSNAVRHTNQGGILLGARRRRHKVEVLCIDTGPGIPEEEQERIFEEFYQTRTESDQTPGMLGMGLAIVKELAELIEAEVLIRSDVGKGSTFGLVLRRHQNTNEIIKNDIINSQRKDPQNAPN